MSISSRLNLAVLGFLCSATAQDDGAIAAARKASDLYQAGRYLDAVDSLKPFAIDDGGSIKSQLAYQYWLQMRAAIDDTPLANSRRRPTPLNAAEQAMLDTVDLVDAIPAIVARAKATRIVILNENHMVSRDRAFGLAVARALRPLGYDVLALEALANDANSVATANRMEALRLRGSPVGNDGYYLRDPEFADFVRQSLSMGYQALPYESTRNDPKADRATSIATREEQQAVTLAQFLKRRSDKKMLIYVGFSHVAEAGIPIADSDRTFWMASRLKKLTGIDPLTIDQTTVGDRNAWPEAYDVLAPRLRNRDAVLVGRSGAAVIGQYRGAVDLQIVHLETMPVHGRPDWLAAMGRHPVAIFSDILPRDGRRLIQAFISREGRDAIPIDQIVVEAGKPPPPLMLPDAPVRYAWQDAKP